MVRSPEKLKLECIDDLDNVSGTLVDRQDPSPQQDVRGEFISAYLDSFPGFTVDKNDFELVSHGLSYRFEVAGSQSASMEAAADGCPIDAETRTKLSITDAAAGAHHGVNFSSDRFVCNRFSLLPVCLFRMGSVPSYSISM